VFIEKNDYKNIEKNDRKNIEKKIFREKSEPI